MEQNADNKNINNPRGLKTVLVARFSAFGDVAMTIPVVYSACRCYPDINFVMVTRSSMTSMFVEAPENFTVVGVDVRQKYAGIAGIRRLVSDINDEFSPDIFVDLHNVLRTKLMSVFFRLKGIRTVRLFKARRKRRELTRPNDKVMLPMVSQRARYREVFFKAGLPLSDRFNGLFGGIGKAPASKFEAITEPKPDGIRWVGIAPYAAHAGKIYPVEQMEDVVAAVSAFDNVRVFLFGSVEEQVVLGKWAQRYKNVTSLAGKRYGFAAELALMNHLNVMLSMDSANMHLAAIAGTRTLSIWGATHPYCGFEAWHQTEADAIQLPLTCRPCSIFGDKPCSRGDYFCLTGITPDLVVSRIKQVIDQK